MSIEVPNLTLRLVKGFPLTAIEGDDNFKTLRNSINALAALFSVSLNDDGTLKNPQIIYGASTAGTDAYLINPTPAITALSSLIGRLIVLKADVGNTGLATLQINATPATGILKFGNQALENDDIKAGQFVVLSYDGANFQMQSELGVVQAVNYGTDVGVANAYVVNQSGINQIPSALYAGLEITFIASATNTGASTLKLGTTPATSIRRVGGLTALEAGDILVGQTVKVSYDGTYFVMISPRRPPQIKTSALTALPAAAGVITFAHGLPFVPNRYWGEIVCVAALGDASYAFNDVIAIGPGLWAEPTTANGQESTAITLQADATNLRAIVAGGGAPAIELWIYDKTGSGAAAMITRASWQVRLYAEYTG